MMSRELSAVHQLGRTYVRAKKQTANEHVVKLVLQVTEAN
jgi:hypothetical protein